MKSARRKGHGMYCPLCGTEHRGGFLRCAECGVELVQDRPRVPEAVYAETVSVFVGDSNSAAAARGRVQSAGIESWFKDEGIHGVFPSLGSTEILVRAKDEKAALLALGAERRP